jgi:hypothetical protein
MLDRVKLGGTGRKTIDLQTRLLGNKRLHFLPGMNWRVIPNQHDWTWNMFQHMLQEIDHLFTSQIALIPLHPQLDPVSFGCHQQRADQVRPLVMLQTGANRWRLPARCPGALEWTDQGFATFVEKNQGCAQGLPLFLPTASDTVSNRQLQHHRVAAPAVVAFGNSNSFGSAHARRRWGDSGL